MTTVIDKNIFNIAVEGNFDDCQKIVKELFVDDEIQESTSLTAVNSINWARLIAQVVYYFWSYFKVETNMTPVNYVVPTGNFGNVYAGFISKRMGLPIKKANCMFKTKTTFSQGFLVMAPWKKKLHENL